MRAHAPLSCITTLLDGQALAGYSIISCLPVLASMPSANGNQYLLV